MAEAQQRNILSADSMLVYRGMDIGTAKPSKEERARVTYGGLDLANPDEPFSVGQYIDHAHAFLTNSNGKSRTIVTGGTGLYTKCLTEGLAQLPPANPALRTWAEAILKRDGVPALQKALQERDAASYEALRDKKNPRRLIRALELAGHDRPKTWTDIPKVPMVGLEIEPDQLAMNIRTRVRKMYDSGLLNEVDQLLSSYKSLSTTAGQAIGYAEAIAVRQGLLSMKDAMDRTIVRTRQLAKRQMTWFRHQTNIVWISVGKTSTIEQLSEQVLAKWEQYGPTPVIR